MGWYAFPAPTRTPRPLIDKLNAEMVRILPSQYLREIRAREGSEPAVSMPEQPGTFLAGEVARLGRIVKSSRTGKAL